MKFNWFTYNDEYKAIVDSWLDDDARRFTSIEDSWDDYVNYWFENSDPDKNEYFWSKVVADENSVPFGVIAIGLCDGVFCISEYLIDPKKRNKGYGSTALKELLLNSEKIIGEKIECANAVIYPKNIASKKVFNKAGFAYVSTHPDGDAMYFSYSNRN